jgi:hypothetical protein
MTTGPAGGAQPGRVISLPGSQASTRPAEVEFRDLRYFAVVAEERSLTPGAYQGLKLMCSEFGGFEVNVTESAGVSTIALDTDWRPIRDGTVIALMAETTARALCVDGVVVVPLKPPPQYVLALAWRPDEQSAAARRCLDYLRTYRDRHAWISDPDMAPLTNDDGPGLVASTSWKNSCVALTEGERRRYAPGIAGGSMCL